MPMPELVYRMNGASQKVIQAAVDMEIECVDEIPPVAFLDRDAKPIVLVDPNGLPVHENRGKGRKIGADYEKFQELRQAHALDSFRQRRGVLKQLAIDNPMADEIFSYGVPRLISGETNEYVVKLIDYITLASAVFYRRGNPIKGMTDGHIDSNMANLRYATDWDVPVMVHINCFWKHERTGIFYAMNDEEQYDTLKLIHSQVTPDIVYCWSHGANLYENNRKRLGDDWANLEALEAHQIRFLENTKSITEEFAA